MFAEKQNGRIPVVSVTGVNGKTTTTRLIQHILRQTGRRVGMTCTEGVYLDSRRLETGDCSGPQSAQKLLANPSVDAVVLETARGGILRAAWRSIAATWRWLPTWAKAIISGSIDIETVEKLARVKRVPVEAVSPDGAAVLNATDKLVAEMAKFCPGSVVFFAIDPEHPVIAKHRTEGRRAVTVRDETIVLVDGDHETPLVSLDRVPITHGGRVGFQVENVLAAVGAALSPGLTARSYPRGLGNIRRRFGSFAGSFQSAGS